MQTVFMFSGQGSQYYQMGRELFDTEATFERSMLELDRLSRARLGVSVLEMLYDPKRKKSDRFDELSLTHPAIFMIEYSLAQLMLAQGVRPDYVLGTSLGEFTALAVAEVLDAPTTLNAVIEQARQLLASCPPGGMATVMAPSELLKSEPELFPDCELVSINAPDMFVIAAPGGSFQRTLAELSHRGIDTFDLAVSRAFHSRFIDAAEYPYREYLETLPFAPPKVQIVSCLFGGLIDYVHTGYLWELSRQRIEFRRALSNLASRHAELLALDLGPYGTLANLATRVPELRNGLRALPVLTPFGSERASFARAVALAKGNGS